MNLKKLITTGLATSMLFAYCVSPAKAVDLVLSTSTYSTHTSVKDVYLPVFERVKNLTNGEVKYDYFEPGTLVPDREYYQGVVDGILDFTYLFPSVQAKSFPLISIMDYPLLFSSSTQGSLVGTKMILENETLAQELKDVKFLWTAFSVPNDLLTLEPVLSLEDLKGKRIGVRTLAIANIIKLLGAVPVQIPMTDMYVALQRGMLDGVLMPIPQYKATKVAEAAKHLTRCNIASASTFYIFNQSRFDSLSEKAQEVFTEMLGIPTSVLESSWIDHTAEVDLKEMTEKQGVTVHDLSAAEKARWEEQVAPMYEDWKKEMSAKGYDPESVLADLNKWIEFYSVPENIAAARKEAEAVYPLEMFPKK